MAFQKVTKSKYVEVQPGVFVYPEGKLRLTGIPGFAPGVKVGMEVDPESGQLRLSPDSGGIFTCGQGGAGATLNIRVALAMIGVRPRSEKCAVDYRGISGGVLEVDLSGLPPA